MNSEFEIIEKEFIRIKPVLTEEKIYGLISRITNLEKTAVVFTSQHAIKFASIHFHPNTPIRFPGQWKIFCLDGITSEMAIKHFSPEQVGSTARNALELSNIIIKASQYKNVIFFCGDKRRDELPQRLQENGIKVEEIIVYETIETPQRISNDIDAVLFFSPSAVRSFFSLNQIQNTTTCFAVGETTASVLSHYTTNRVITSEAASSESMMTCVRAYFKHLNCQDEKDTK
jgi:uroporphyrinogen-III synthase